MSIQSWGPVGNTIKIAVTQTASSAVQAPGANYDPTQYLVKNTGANIAYLVAASSNANSPGGSALAAVIPTGAGGSAANGIPILPNEIAVYRFPPNAWFSAICDAGLSTTLWITPGEGM